mgnify:CR=1 FL=1
MKQIILLLFFSFGLYQFSFSCDCGKSEHKEEYRRTDLIVKGKILSIEDDPKSCYNGYCNVVFIKIQIIDTFKGEVIRTIINLHTNKYPSGCGYPFERNEIYLLYLNKHSLTETFSTSLCSRTTGDYEIALKLISEINQIEKEIEDEKWPKIRLK